MKAQVNQHGGKNRKSRSMVRRITCANPVHNRRKARLGHHAVRFYDLDEVRSLFRFLPRADLGILALALFAALRPTSLDCLATGDVDTVNRRIFIRSEKSSDRKSRVLEGHNRGQDGMLRAGLPDVLWEWLERFPFVESRWDRFQKHCRKALELHWASADIHDSAERRRDWIPHGLRHTGATYYAQVYGAEAARFLLGHERVTVSSKHFIGSIDLETAIEFFEIGPGALFGEGGDAEGRKHISWPSDQKLKALW